MKVKPHNYQIYSRQSHLSKSKGQPSEYLGLLRRAYPSAGILLQSGSWSWGHAHPLEILPMKLNPVKLKTKQATAAMTEEWRRRIPGRELLDVT
jgi:hypothetical protein